MEGVCDGRGIADRDCGADDDGGADRPIGRMGDADRARVCDTYDRGGSIDCVSADIGGDGDTRDGHDMA